MSRSFQLPKAGLMHVAFRLSPLLERNHTKGGEKRQADDCNGQICVLELSLLGD